MTSVFLISVSVQVGKIKKGWFIQMNHQRWKWFNMCHIQMGDILFPWGEADKENSLNSVLASAHPESSVRPGETSWVQFSLHLWMSNDGDCLLLQVWSGDFLLHTSDTNCTSAPTLCSLKSGLQTFLFILFIALNYFPFFSLF